MKPKIYSYYESIQTLPQAEQFARANYWKTSWEKNGWDCVMLNRSHAQASNAYQKFMAKIMKMSFDLPMDYQHVFPHIIARYSRWSALHAAGGGWMSDYDVVNIDFTPHDAGKFESTLNIVSGEPCYLFFATREHCASVISKFIQEDFFVDNKLRFESEILGVESKLSDMLKQVRHIEKSDKPKSEVMASLM
jgi:hypothetical protein